MKKRMSELFNEELKELTIVEQVIANPGSGREDLVSSLKSITSHYARLIKSMSKLIIISDSQQEYLQEIQIELKREIAARKQAEEKLTYYAYTDALTGVSNRRTGLMLLERELKSVHKNHLPLAVIYIDVDGLKYVNDKYGHAEGDYLILTISGLIMSEIRDIDIICRLGGDEFLAIMPNCKEIDAENVIKRINKKLEEHNNKETKPFKLEFSYGIEVTLSSDDVAIDELISKADVKMYEQKKNKKRCRNEVHQLEI